MCVSLTRHTPQSQGKRGLVTMRTTSCTGDKILSHPIRFKILNLLLSNTLLAMESFAIVCDVFVYIAFHANKSLYAGSPDVPLFS